MSDPRYNGKSAAQQQADHLAWAEEQTARFLCGIPGCGWAYEGVLAVGRDQARQHRAIAHPERATRTHRKGGQSKHEVSARMARWRREKPETAP